MLGLRTSCVCPDPITQSNCSGNDGKSDCGGDDFVKHKTLGVVGVHSYRRTNIGKVRAESKESFLMRPALIVMVSEGLAMVC